MRRLFTFLILALLFASCRDEPQRLFPDEPLVRVLILDTDIPVEILALSDWYIQTGNSNPLSINEQESVQLTYATGSIRLERLSANNHHIHQLPSLTLRGSTDAATLLIRNVPYGVGWWWAGAEDREYEGTIRVHPVDGGRLQVVVELPLERYIKGVVPYEIGGDSPMEALKAQAVAARSEAVRAITTRLYSGPHHDVTSDVESQVFSGNLRRTEASDRAVDETASLILTVDGQPINAYYASNCGGHSELIRNVWPDRPDPAPYHFALSDSRDRTRLDIGAGEDRLAEWIRSSPEVYCNPDREPGLPAWSRANFRWERVFGGDEISRMVADGIDSYIKSSKKEDENPKPAALCINTCGRLTGIQPVKRGPSGRMYEARIVFENKTFEAKGELAIRQLFSPSLRSSAFVVERDVDRWFLTGAGWGHGVGMCQSGAVAQALQGREFAEILRHYYPSTVLSRSW